MTQAILFVDDEPNILSSFRRGFHKRFKVVTACGAEEGLQCLKDAGPFAVVISDMRMPGMDGVAFLAAVRAQSPATVRMMLTGNADQETAVKAINEGSIFRFFTKPCPPEVMTAAIEDALEQYRLVTAEKELLEQTLAGSVKVLVDVLTLLDPMAFGKVGARRALIDKIGKTMKLPRAWEIEMAAMLCELGSISVPPAILSKVRKGYRLTADEQKLIDESPGVATKLMANIPRMEAVCDLVLYQNRGYDGSGFPEDGPAGGQLPLGARLLKIVNDLLEVCENKPPNAAAFETLANQPRLYDPELFNSVRAIVLEDEDGGAPLEAVEVEDVKISSLRPGQRLASEIVTKSGKLVLGAGVVVTPAQIVILRNFASIRELGETVKVLKAAPKRPAEEKVA